MSVKRLWSRLVESTLVVPLCYAIFAGLWIVFSDKFLAALVADATELTRMQTFKGIFFVATTTILLYFLVCLNRRALDLTLSHLRVSEERLQATLENTPHVAVQWFDYHGRLIYWNSTSERLHGRTAKEAIGKSLVEIGYLPESAQRLQNMIERITKTGQPEGPAEFECQRPDGTRVLLANMLFAIPVRDQEACIASMGLDITTSKEIERKLIETNKELTRLSQVRSEFVSMVSHELRTPLAVIREAINLVLDGVDGPITAAQKETLDMSQNSVDRLSRLIQNVLDFTKIEAGKIGLLLTTTDLSGILREIYDFMTIATQKKNLRFDIALPPGATLVKCDADKIRQIIINLLDNAIKFTPPGGTIALGLAASDDGYEISIRDSGIGIPTEDQTRIFKMFEQSTAGKFTRVGGVGVGLAVCKMFTDMHAGRIVLESAPGKGSHFRIWLPTRGPALTESMDTTLRAHPHHL